jgi:hypothetical protein
MLARFQNLRWRPSKVPAANGAGGECDFAALAAECRTQNEFNRLTINLENTLAPAEICQIATVSLSAGTRERSAAWFKKLGKWQPDLFQSPQQYQREVLSPRAIFYRHPLMPTRDKNMLLAFCGNAERLMIPVAVFLQMLDSSLWDVLVVRKRISTTYSEGEEGVADDFPGLVSHLQSKLSPAPYRNVMTFGTSAGGFFALWAAALIGAQRGVSIAGFLPRNLAKPTLPVPVDADLRLVFGETCSRDRDRALLLQTLVGGRLTPVADVGNHNVLGTLMKQGRLRNHLDEMLA